MDGGNRTGGRPPSSPYPSTSYVPPPPRATRQAGLTAGGFRVASHSKLEVENDSFKRKPPRGASAPSSTFGTLGKSSSVSSALPPERRLDSFIERESYVPPLDVLLGRPTPPATPAAPFVPAWMQRTASLPGGLHLTAIESTIRAVGSMAQDVGQVLQRSASATRFPQPLFNLRIHGGGPTAHVQRDPLKVVDHQVLLGPTGGYFFPVSAEDESSFNANPAVPLRAPPSRQRSLASRSVSAPKLRKSSTMRSEASEDSDRSEAPKLAKQPTYALHWFVGLDIRVKNRILHACVRIQRWWRTVRPRRKFLKLKAVAAFLGVRRAGAYFYPWRQLVRAKGKSRYASLKRTFVAWHDYTKESTKFFRAAASIMTRMLQSNAVSPIAVWRVAQGNSDIVATPSVAGSLLLSVMPERIRRYRLKTSLKQLQAFKNHVKARRKQAYLKLNTLAIRASARRTRLVMTMWCRYALFKRAEAENTQLAEFKGAVIVQWDTWIEKYKRRKQMDKRLRDDYAKLVRKRRWLQWKAFIARARALHEKMRRAIKFHFRAVMEAPFRDWCQVKKFDIAQRHRLRVMFLSLSAFVKEKRRQDKLIKNMQNLVNNNRLFFAMDKWKQNASADGIVSAVGLERLLQATATSSAFSYAVAAWRSHLDEGFEGQFCRMNWVMHKCWRAWTGRAQRRVTFEKLIAWQRSHLQQKWKQLCFAGWRDVCPKQAGGKRLDKIPAPMRVDPGVVARVVAALQKRANLSLDSEGFQETALDALARYNSTDIRKVASDIRNLNSVLMWRMCSILLRKTRREQQAKDEARRKRIEESGSLELLRLEESKSLLARREVLGSRELVEEYKQSLELKLMEKADVLRAIELRGRGRVLQGEARDAAAALHRANPLFSLDEREANASVAFIRDDSDSERSDVYNDAGSVYNVDEDGSISKGPPAQGGAGSVSGSPAKLAADAQQQRMRFIRARHDAMRASRGSRPDGEADDDEGLEGEEDSEDGDDDDDGEKVGKRMQGGDLIFKKKIARPVIASPTKDPEEAEEAPQSAGSPAPAPETAPETPAPAAPAAPEPEPEPEASAEEEEAEAASPASLRGGATVKTALFQFAFFGEIGGSRPAPSKSDEPESPHSTTSSAKERAKAAAGTAAAGRVSFDAKPPPPAAAAVAAAAGAPKPQLPTSISKYSKPVPAPPAAVAKQAPSLPQRSPPSVSPAQASPPASSYKPPSPAAPAQPSTSAAAGKKHESPLPSPKEQPKAAAGSSTPAGGAAASSSQPAPHPAPAARPVAPPAESRPASAQQTKQADGSASSIKQGAGELAKPAVAPEPAPEAPTKESPKQQREAPAAAGVASEAPSPAEPAVAAQAEPAAQEADSIPDTPEPPAAVAGGAEAPLPAPTPPEASAPSAADAEERPESRPASEAKEEEAVQPAEGKKPGEEQEEGDPDSEASESDEEEEVGAGLDFGSLLGAGAGRAFEAGFPDIFRGLDGVATPPEGSSFETLDDRGRRKLLEGLYRAAQNSLPSSVERGTWQRALALYLGRYGSSDIETAQAGLAAYRERKRLQRLERRRRRLLERGLVAKASAEEGEPPVQDADRPASAAAQAQAALEADGEAEPAGAEPARVEPAFASEEADAAASMFEHAGTIELPGAGAGAAGRPRSSGSTAQRTQRALAREQPSLEELAMLEDKWWGEQPVSRPGSSASTTRSGSRHASAKSARAQREAPAGPIPSAPVVLSRQQPPGSAEWAEELAARVAMDPSYQLTEEEAALLSAASLGPLDGAEGGARGQQQSSAPAAGASTGAERKGSAGGDVSPWAEDAPEELEGGGAGGAGAGRPASQQERRQSTPSVGSRPRSQQSTSTGGSSLPPQPQASPQERAARAKARGGGGEGGGVGSGELERLPSAGRLDKGHPELQPAALFGFAEKFAAAHEKLQLQEIARQRAKIQRQIELLEEAQRHGQMHDEQMAYWLEQLERNTEAALKERERLEQTGTYVLQGRDAVQHSSFTDEAIVPVASFHQLPSAPQSFGRPPGAGAPGPSGAPYSTKASGGLVMGGVLQGRRVGPASNLGAAMGAEPAFSGPPGGSGFRQNFALADFEGEEPSEEDWAFPDAPPPPPPQTAPMLGRWQPRASPPASSSHFPQGQPLPFDRREPRGRPAGPARGRSPPRGSPHADEAAFPPGERLLGDDFPEAPAREAGQGGGEVPGLDWARVFHTTEAADDLATFAEQMLNFEPQQRAPALWPPAAAAEEPRPRSASPTRAEELAAPAPALEPIGIAVHVGVLQELQRLSPPPAFLAPAPAKPATARRPLPSARDRPPQHPPRPQPQARFVPPKPRNPEKEKELEAVRQINLMHTAQAPQPQPLALARPLSRAAPRALPSRGAEAAARPRTQERRIGHAARAPQAQERGVFDLDDGIAETGWITKVRPHTAAGGDASLVLPFVDSAPEPPAPPPPHAALLEQLAAAAALARRASLAAAGGQLEGHRRDVLPFVQAAAVPSHAHQAAAATTTTTSTSTTIHLSALPALPAATSAPSPPQSRRDEPPAEELNASGEELPAALAEGEGEVEERPRVQLPPLDAPAAAEEEEEEAARGARAAPEGEEEEDRPAPPPGVHAPREEYPEDFEVPELPPSRAGSRPRGTLSKGRAPLGPRAAGSPPRALERRPSHGQSFPRLEVSSSFEGPSPAQQAARMSLIEEKDEVLRWEQEALRPSSSSSRLAPAPAVPSRSSASNLRAEGFSRFLGSVGGSAAASAQAEREEAPSLAAEGRSYKIPAEYADMLLKARTVADAQALVEQILDKGRHTPELAAAYQDPRAFLEELRRTYASTRVLSELVEKLERSAAAGTQQQRAVLEAYRQRAEQQHRLGPGPQRQQQPAAAAGSSSPAPSRPRSFVEAIPSGKRSGAPPSDLADSVSVGSVRPASRSSSRPQSRERQRLESR